MQERQLAEVYRPDESAKLDTTVYTPGDTAKQIARKILLDDYSEFSFQARLDEIVNNGGRL